MPRDLDRQLDPTLGPPEEQEPDHAGKPLDPRPALCLSGGGYRAMVFHVGALWRLNELGWLPKLGRVSSVSGGSITAAVLGLAWKQLGFQPSGVAANFDAKVVQPVRKLAGIGVDVPAVVEGAVLPFVSISDRVAAAYREHLFGKATLQELPTDAEGPRFVINATSVQTGALFRFSRPYLADYKVGVFPNPKVQLAEAVAASSAFPPVLSPADLDLRGLDYQEHSGKPEHPDFRRKAVLTDGGVYDNLGLETAYKRHELLLVSDGGGAMGADDSPAHDWVRHLVRVLNVIDNQVRSLRKRLLIDAYEAKLRSGTYWGIRTNQADYPTQGPIHVPHDRSLALANEPTRLAKMAPQLQERLINWGYAVCDTALRSHVLGPNPGPASLPYPRAGI